MVMELNDALRAVAGRMPGSGVGENTGTGSGQRIEPGKAGGVVGMARDEHFT